MEGDSGIRFNCSKKASDGLVNTTSSYDSATTGSSGFFSAPADAPGTDDGGRLSGAGAG